MRTTLDLPEALLEEARTALGFKSKTDTIVLALRSWSGGNGSSI